MIDLHNGTAPAAAGTGALGIPASISATANGVSIDCRGVHEVQFLVHVGAITADTVDGSNYWDLYVQQAKEDAATPDQADSTDWAAVPVANMIGSKGAIGTSGNAAYVTAGLFATIDATAEDELWYRVTVRQPKAYCRFRAVETGTVGATTFYVLAVRGTTHLIPAAGSTGA